MANGKTFYILAIHSLLAHSVAVGSVDSLLTASKKALDSGKIIEAKQYGFEALELAKERGEDAEEATASYRLANAFQASENYQSAEVHYNRALELADIVGDSHLLAKTLTTFGIMKLKVGDVQDAQLGIEHALRLAEELKDSTILMFCHLHHGRIFHYQENFEAAVASYQRALELAERNGHEAVVAGCHQNLSEAHASLGRWDEATASARKSIAIRIRLRDEYHLGKSYENLIYQQFERGDGVESLRTLAELLDVFADSEMQLSEETASATSELLTELSEDLSSAQNTVKWLFAFVGLCLLLSIILSWRLIQERKTARKKLERTALRIRQMESAIPKGTLKQRIEPLRKHTNPLLATSYLMLSVGYTRPELTQIFGRDRATIHRWLEEMSRILKVKDVPADARSFGDSTSNIPAQQPSETADEIA